MIEREAQLERRIRRLDRSRRGVAVGVAFVIAGLVYWQIPSVMGDDWPQAHRIASAFAIAAIAWLVMEVALAAAAAVWESELDRLTCNRELPRAEVRTRRPRFWQF